MLKKNIKYLKKNVNIKNKGNKLQKVECLEQEIDLRELFNVIWRKRFFVVMVTLVLTLCTIIYVFFKTPLYQVKSIVEIGFIDKQLLEEPSILEQKLKVVFDVDNKEINNNPDIGIISSISQMKVAKNFIELNTEAISNEIAINKAKEILDYIQRQYKAKIDQYQILVDKDIMNTEKEIIFLKNEKINMLTQKIELNKASLEKYLNEINSLNKSSINSTDKISSMIVSVQMVNYQNLIENIQNTIKSSSLEIEQILSTTIPKLEQQKEILKVKISEQNLTNSRLVGNFITSEYPAKPKKSLIILTGFITGFILSIFIVLIMQFNRKEN